MFSGVWRLLWNHFYVTESFVPSFRGSLYSIAMNIYYPRQIKHITFQVVCHKTCNIVGNWRSTSAVLSGQANPTKRNRVSQAFAHPCYIQVLLLIMLILNLSAAVVIFGVPVNVRGRHVAFLFICVRVLNLLDLYQVLYTSAFRDRTVSIIATF